MIEVFNENKYTIDEFCKSKDFELIKKEYRMVKRNLPAPKPKNRETLTNWYLSLGKVQVADNLYMYPYQAIILKLVFNHKYLAKMINHYDSTWFSRDNKFKEFTDHYANIVSWLKTDIEKNILKQGNNQFDRYYYYNWGVDRNEIL
jgi:cyclopropane fatty-acyl-phospholipid synthase-like methyltransferase